jgi:hypothetical protein
MRAIAACMVVSLLGMANASKGSPVEAVVSLLGDMSSKVKTDLEKESAAMEEYLQFCSDETKAKMFAMKTADRSIADFSAIVVESKAVIAEKEDEISSLGSFISDKEKELSTAADERSASKATFVATEKELADSADACARAVAALNKGMSFAQTHGGLRMKKALEAQAVKIQNAIQAIASAARIDTESRKKLQKYLQTSQKAEDADDDDLSIKQQSFVQQPEAAAYESKSGGIVELIKQTGDKVKEELSAVRKKEMENVHTFKMLEQGIMSEIDESKEKLSAATAAKNGATEAANKAEGDLVETQKTRAADQAYADEIRAECETSAKEWEAKEKEAKAEMEALAKAKEILVGGVKAASLIQVKVKTKRYHAADFDDADVREMVVHKLQGLGRKLHSFAMMQMASAASSDPFVKIRGLIEDMIASLLKQAQEEATQKAFCDTEMGKSKKSKADKSMKLDKYQARVDKAMTGIAELTEQVKELEADLAEIDKATAEATAIRTEENTDNVKAMKDFKDSADAVISAIGVLKQFYEAGPEFIQTSMKVRSKMGMQGDGSGIISILEVAEEDFTRLFAETEESEKQAAESYEKLLTDNKVAKATKQAELKGKATEIKSLEVALSQAKEDHTSVGEELDAVLAYIDKLKPQCETKAMSYEEKVARRNAEIEGLKEALGILEGTGIAALVQSPRAFRVHRHF